jgi:hypothetical protein
VHGDVTDFKDCRKESLGALCRAMGGAVSDHGQLQQDGEAARFRRQQRFRKQSRITSAFRFQLEDLPPNFTLYEGEIMAANSPDTDFKTSNERVVAFFRVQQDAFRAISELKEAGFTSSEIGLMSKGTGTPTEDVKATTADAGIERHNLGGDDVDGEHSESMWEKLKHFFGGDSSEDADYRESAAGMHWDERRGDRYYRGLEEGGAVVTVAGRRAEEAREILQDAGAELQEQEAEFEVVEQNLSDRGDGLDSVGNDIEEIDDEGLDAEDVDREAARRDRDYRIQLHGEAFRSFRNRMDSRDEGFGTQSLQEEPGLDELETSDNATFEDSRNKLRKPAA